MKCHAYRLISTLNRHSQPHLSTVANIFPPVSEADEYGIVAMGGDYSLEILTEAYTHGIFPWPHPEMDLIPWFSPPKRGLLFFKDIKGRKRTLRYQKAMQAEIRINTAFTEVMKACAQARASSKYGTWITKDMIAGYSLAHQAGLAHSVEVYASPEPGTEAALVGGIYGIRIGGMFAAESMFHTVPNASKIALLALCDHLASQGASWIDCQELSPHILATGGIEVPRERYLTLLNEARHRPSLQFPGGPLSWPWPLIR